jgi:hypothetical protein
LNEVHRTGPDLLVNSGDLSVNGADEDDDLAFALSEHGHVTLPWRAIPGNHDVGEEPEAVHLGQIIDGARLERHEARVQTWEGIDLLWCPSTAFPASQPRASDHAPLGWVQHQFDGAGHRVVVVECDLLERHDLEALKKHGRYQFLCQTPPAPVPAGAHRS